MSKPETPTTPPRMVRPPAKVVAMRCCFVRPQLEFAGNGLQARSTVLPRTFLNRSKLKRQFINAGLEECRERTATRKRSQELLHADVGNVPAAASFLEGRAFFRVKNM